MGRILEALENVKHRTLLITTYAAGLRVRELTHLRVRDIDSDRMTLRIVQGKGAKDGVTVGIRERTGHYDILYQGAVIASHAAQGRYAVIMEPAHYAGLLRPRGAPAPASPPRFDPAYPASADVVVRDLGIYAAIAEEAAV